MARLPRRELINECVVGIYHCWNGCVQQRWLLGDDKESGRDYEYRKGWVESELKRLAGGFAIDVVSFAVLSNHFHVILRNRPDLVRDYTDDEVIRRWWMICPARRSADGNPAPIEEAYVLAQCADRERIAELRRRLSSISWLLRLWTHRLARRANRESGKRGHFWEGRFNSRRLLSEAALLVCMGYVDLNPIRAGICRRLDRSRYTSIYLRIKTSRYNGLDLQRLEASSFDVPDAWLTPLYLSEVELPDRQPSVLGSPRASNKGLLPIQLEGYIELLDWTAHQLRSDKAEETPKHLDSLFEQLGIVSDAWVDAIREFDQNAGHWVGNSDELKEQARKLDRKWLHGVGYGRRFFRC